jgi:hypothetical protein
MGLESFLYDAEDRQIAYCATSSMSSATMKYFYDGDEYITT